MSRTELESVQNTFFVICNKLPLVAKENIYTSGNLQRSNFFMFMTTVYVHVLSNEDSTHGQEGLAQPFLCYPSYTGFSLLLYSILPNFPSTPPLPFLCSAALD